METSEASHAPSSDIALWTGTYDVTSYLSNSQKNLGLFALLNLLQDAAALHADRLGFGYDDMVRRKTFWVLTRQKLALRKWPKWKDRVSLRTWIRLNRGPFSNRDFEIFLGDEKIGECTASWVAVSAETRKPTNIDLGDLFDALQTERKVSVEAGKIELRSDLESIAKFQVRNSDIDQNQHVNNTRYAQWVLDSIPLEDHRKHSLREYEVNFLAETHVGDVITIRKGEAPASDGLRRADFQGVRESDDKIVFAARLGFVEL
jgi:acyl-ACP thioesterase